MVIDTHLARGASDGGFTFHDWGGPCLGLRRVGWDDRQPVFRPIRYAWRVEVAHGRIWQAARVVWEPRA